MSSYQSPQEERNTKNFSLISQKIVSKNIFVFEEPILLLSTNFAHLHNATF
jgi:hypothetical protein